MSETSYVVRAGAQPFPSVFEMRTRLSIAEQVVLVFFVYITIAAVVLQLSARDVGIIVALNALNFITLLALNRNRQRAPWLAVTADFYPALLILAAYRESGLLLTPDPSHHLDDVFIHWDRVLLNNHFLEAMLHAGTPWLQHYLEFAYLLCYPLVPLGVAAIYCALLPSTAGDLAAARVRHAMDNFWATVLLATLFCYAVYPFFPLTPPRVLFADVPGPHVDPLLRQWNFWLLDHYSVQACIFPSGHVAAVTAVALAVRKHAPRLGVLFLILAASVALATVYGRYHYAADAVAGMLVGVAAYRVSEILRSEMRNRFSSFHGVPERGRMTLCFLLLSLAAANVFSQAPPNVDEPGRPTPSKLSGDDEEPQARAWLAIRQKEQGQFKKVAEGMYLIKSNTALNKSGQPSEVTDAWTLWKSEGGGFQVDGELKASHNGTMGASTSYEVKLNSQMRPAAYKIFGRKLVSGCVWTESKLFCQETYGRGDVEGAAGASIDSSTRFLSPLFPFLFNGLTPLSKIQSGETQYLTLLSLSYSDEPGALIDLIPEYASLSLIRRGNFSILETSMDGSEFQLGVREIPHAMVTNPQAPVIPPDPEHKDQYKPFCRFVVASNGILLSASDGNTQREFIRLVQYKKLADI